MPASIVSECPESHVWDYFFGGAGVLTEYIAVRYGPGALGWFAALLFFLAFYDFTKTRLSARGHFVRFGIPFGAACALIVGTIVLLHMKPKTTAVSVQLPPAPVSAPSRTPNPYEYRNPRKFSRPQPIPLQVPQAQ